MRRFGSMAAAVLVLGSLATGCGYNTIQQKDESVNAALGQVKVQLQRRADLIPNLVEVVKGVAKQESTVFLGVAEARAKLGGAIQGGGSPAQLAEANASLSGALGRLLAIAEAYPELKSNQNFLELQSQIEGTENRLSVARQDYNDKVRDFNVYIRTFPYNLTAKVTGHGKPREYFETTGKEAEEPPKVKF
jgi:LemA protein